MVAGELGDVSESEASDCLEKANGRRSREASFNVIKADDRETHKSKKFDVPASVHVCVDNSAEKLIVTMYTTIAMFYVLSLSLSVNIFLNHDHLAFARTVLSSLCSMP